MSRGRKIVLAVAVPLVLALLVVGVQALRGWWYRGYSHGTRTGVIRKLTQKGSPLCRYFEGEMALVGAQPGHQPEMWTFTLDDPAPGSVLVQKLEAAAKTAQPVTVEYRQDLGNKGKWIVCAPTDYYVIGVK